MFEVGVLGAGGQDVVVAVRDRNNSSKACNIAPRRRWRRLCLRQPHKGGALRAGTKIAPHPKNTQPQN